MFSSPDFQMEVSLPPSVPAPTLEGFRPPVPTPNQNIRDPKQQRLEVGHQTARGKVTLQEKSPGEMSSPVIRGQGKRSPGGSKEQ